MGFRRTLTKLICVTAFLASAAPAGAAPTTAKAPAREACGTANLLEGRKALLATPEIKGDLRLVTDGAAAQEGAMWDAPVAVTWDSRTASITYDLGAPRSISALFLQADANDTYKILGSLDDTSASYHVIADVPNVVDRGHGLRNRALEIAPTTVRYLRFGDGDGDGFFSLSELAAYCQKPVPFPPALRTVDAAPAVVSDSAPAGTPPTAVALLNREVGNYLRSPEAQGIFLKAGIEPSPGTPEEFAAVMKSEVERIAPVLKAAGAGAARR